MTETIDTHQALIYRIGEVRPHPNADKLELTDLAGYQMVIGKGQYKTGDFAVFIQPDSVIPQTEPFKFIWEKYVGIDGKVPESRRRIAPKRLRGEWSEGLLMPLHEVGLVTVAWQDKIGQDVASVIGVTHYVPEFDRESTAAESKALPKRRYPKTLKGWFFWTIYKCFGLGRKNYTASVSFDSPYFNVKSYKNFKNRLQSEDKVTATEKIHGSNARYVTIDGTFYAGSHEQWKLDGNNVWWNAARQHPEIKEWCDANPGMFLYGEVGPTQKGFRYGCGDGETFFFAFRVYDVQTQTWHWPGSMGMCLLVPVLYTGSFDAEYIKNHVVDGPSVVPGAKNIREGVVINKFGDTRSTGLKWVSNEYLAAKK
jgi:hypothetical protein